ncbi:MAG: COG4315 family predicted lipoprotein [Streptosporangiaceae bacterium]
MSATGITTASTPGGKILVTAQGYTIYEFAPDTPTKSACSAQCLAVWPALIGTASAAPGSGLTGKFGTITGTGGITQATYDGHPLYLFVKDTKPGMMTGNGLNGAWFVITPSGARLTAAVAPAPASAPTSVPAKSSAPSAKPSAKPTASASSGGGGGYGY